MTLTCKNPFAKTSYGPGIYVNTVTILAAEDISGTALPFMENPFDIAIRLILDVGRDFQPELVIGGQFKRDASSGEVIGWGNAFVVQEALSRLGYTGPPDPNNSIPPSVLETLVGKQFLRLSYTSGVKDTGKLRYSDWNQIASVEDGAENLVKRFKRSLTRGYPKNYHPEVLDAEPVTTEAPF